MYPVSFCKSVHNSFPLNNIEHAALDMQTELDIGLHMKCLLKLSDVNKNFNGKTIFHSQVVSCIPIGIRNNSNRCLVEMLTHITVAFNLLMFICYRIEQKKESPLFFI